MDHQITPQKVPYMQNRELSWLAFNKRVLDQGADSTVPLLERLNFISIFWSNLQEFFMVRVGSLTDLSLVKKSIIDPKSGMTPSEQLDAIYARCHELYPYYQQTYEQLRDQLAAEGVEQVQPASLTDEQRAFLDTYVHTSVMPFLSPQIINARHPFPHLENGALYIVVRLDEEADVPTPKKDKKSKKADGAGKGDKSEKSEKSGKSDKHSKGDKADKAEKAAAKEARISKNLGAEGVTLGLIPLPRQCDRVVQLPGKGFQFVLLEHVIEMYAAEVFSMYKVKHTNVICVTRNADLDATEGTDEQGEDYREHMKRILKKRSRLAPVRLESERALSSTIKPLLLKRLELKEHQVFVTSVPLDMSYTWGLAGHVSPKKRAALTQAPFTPQWPASLERNQSIIKQVSEREVLLSYPYESMDAFVQLLREAAADPAVLSIKITLYRLASQSHLAEALIAAAEAGKEVTALFELRARFDESNNIEWSQRFEQAGCHVIYGFRDFKVHSKICCITRQAEGGLQYITQLGTGNYNEKTARLYTDYSFITTDPSIGRDAMQFFRNMALENTSDDYDILWVAPLQIKQNIMAGIDEQIECARRGEPAGLFFKTNSVTDKDVIEKIVEASQAGVACTLFVRGISCIVPGVAGYTDNVRVVSIVGRLLEHSRIYCFGPWNNCKVYLSSADLMTRNMDKRIEIAWPILNDDLRDQVLGYLTTCMSDTAKLRELLPSSEYTELGYFAREGAKKRPSAALDARALGAGAEVGAGSGNDAAAEAGAGASAAAEAGAEGGAEALFESQSYLIAEAQRKHLAAAELEAHTQANRVRIGGRAFLRDPFGEEASEFVEPPAAAASVEAPAEPTPAPAEPTPASAERAPASAEAAPASAEPAPASVPAEPTPAPAEPTPAAAERAFAPTPESTTSSESENAATPVAESATTPASTVPTEAGESDASASAASDNNGEGSALDGAPASAAPAAVDEIVVDATPVEEDADAEATEYESDEEPPARDASADNASADDASARSANASGRAPALDPEQVARARAAAVSAATVVAHAAGNIAANVAKTAGSAASTVAKAAGEKASDAAKTAGEKASNVAKVASERASDAAQTAGERAADAAKVAGARASETAKVAGTVAANAAKAAGSAAADAARNAARNAGNNVADAARNASGTTARAARQAAKNAGSAAADAARQAAASAKENALARREAPKPTKRPSLISRLFGALTRKK